MKENFTWLEEKLRVQGFSATERDAILAQARLGDAIAEAVFRVWRLVTRRPAAEPKALRQA